MLYDYLYQTYGVNTPIFTCEIQYKDYSDSWLFTELNKLCGNGELARFEKGVYSSWTNNGQDRAACSRYDGDGMPSHRGPLCTQWGPINFLLTCWITSKHEQK